jgi:hypothetical protein
MFEVGKSYTIKMWEDDDSNAGTITTYPRCRILEVQMPAIKIRQTLLADAIINTGSLAFVSAIPEEDEEDEEIEED